jgi:hypothetical protein
LVRASCVALTALDLLPAFVYELVEIGRDHFDEVMSNQFFTRPSKNAKERVVTELEPPLRIHDKDPVK